MTKQVITDQAYYRTLAILTDIASKHPLLNKKQERAMIDKYRDDRQKLNTLLINHNVRIILNTARKYINKSTSPADLLVDGYYGLTIAAERFDLDKNIKFNTYATAWVFKYVISQFYSKSPEVGVNAFSINQEINTTTDNDMSAMISAANFAADYQNMTTITDSVKEITDFSTRDIIANVIAKLDADNKLTDFGRAIIQRNLIDGESLAKLSAEYNIKYTDAAAEKRYISSSIKATLATEYNINQLSDILAV